MKMRLLVPSALILLFLALVASCGSERDCPDLTLIGSGAACPKDTNWVCGCDDSTYINECIANRRGIWVQYKGECE